MGLVDPDLAPHGVGPVGVLGLWGSLACHDDHEGSLCDAIIIRFIPQRNGIVPNVVISKICARRSVEARPVGLSSAGLRMTGSEI
jgi:hypothetical protein